MLRIITKKRLELLKKCEAIVEERNKASEVTYNCGAKGCQYQTTDPSVLSAHREMHKM